MLMETDREMFATVILTEMALQMMKITAQILPIQANLIMTMTLNMILYLKEEK